MREADSLGIYVIMAGSGTDWGYFPGLKDSCKGPMDCYKKGGVLGFGRQVVRVKGSRAEDLRLKGLAPFSIAQCCSVCMVQYVSVLYSIVC